ncbi:MAG: electron transfer flavoprotein subunit alpha/FixB family protein [Gemmatimonadetes bacterium]|nr:electron transfer flavoprotein subunit alpha/FixB family protein [Gemmatimonadota bacterium]
MANVLAFAEQRDGEIRGAAREATSAAFRVASGLGGEAHALLLGAPGIAASASELGRFGAAVVAVGEHEALGDYNPDAYAPVVADRVRSGGYGVVIFPATTLGKDLAPRVAALLDVPLASDVTGLEVEGGALTVVRPIYAGKAFAHLAMNATPAVVSIRPNVFQPVENQAAGTVEGFAPTVDAGAWGVHVVERKSAGEGALDVAEATVIVSGGRGMKDPSNWPLLEGLRDAIGEGVALGASRAVVDAGWRPHGEQVGQTGKTVSPKLYFAIGISGAIQHLAGMRTSKTIVAVNKDPDAPIFNVADYGIVGDLFDVVPRLTEEVKALKAKG